MTLNLRTLITQVNDTSMLVASSSQELSASAQETNCAGEHSVNVTIELADGANVQLQNLEGSYQAVQDMSRFISEIASSAGIALNHANHQYRSTDNKRLNNNIIGPLLN